MARFLVLDKVEHPILMEWIYSPELDRFAEGDRSSTYREHDRRQQMMTMRFMEGLVAEHQKAYQEEAGAIEAASLNGIRSFIRTF